MNLVRDYSAPIAPARGEMQPMTGILAAAQKAAPEGWPVATISMPEKLGQSAAVQVALPPGRRPQQGVNFVGLTIYVDPVSLKILGSEERRRAGPLSRNLTTMHVALMAPGYYGLQLVGVLGVAMVLFGLSGLTLWWPRKGQWRSAFGRASYQQFYRRPIRQPGCALCPHLGQPAQRRAGRFRAIDHRKPKWRRGVRYSRAGRAGSPDRLVHIRNHSGWNPGQRQHL